MCDRNQSAEDVRAQRSTQAATAGRPMTSEERVNIMFTYHHPDDLQVMQFTAIRDAAKHLAYVILHNSPPSADQTAALRKLSEAVMTANAAVSRRGVSA